MRSSYRMKRRKPGRGGMSHHMALVPFIDIMTILVVFLLVYSSDTEILPNSKNISIPMSIAESKPRPTVVVMVTKENLYVNGRPIARVDDVMAADQRVIEPLKQALLQQADRVLVQAAREDVTEREVTIMGDKSVPFRVLQRVMATCTDADYGKVSLATIQRERAIATAPGAGGAG